MSAAEIRKSAEDRMSKSLDTLKILSLIHI